MCLTSCSHHVTTQCLTSRIEKEVTQGKPVLKIGDQIIYQGQIDILMEIMPGFKTSWDSTQDRKNLIAQLIEQELFYQKAKELDLISKNDRLQKNLWLQTRNYQAGTYLLQEVDQQAKIEYERNKDQLFSQVEIKEIVFLFKNTGAQDEPSQQKIAMKKAVELRKNLTDKNFSKLASEHSENPFGKANGGNIGVISWIDQRVKFMGWKPLVETAFKLKKGRISQPIVTDEGVHIIQVASDKQTQSYQDSETFLRTQLEQSVKNALLEQMLATTKIEYLDPTLDPNSK